MRKNILLIGFMGVGKEIITARAMYELSGAFAFDCDDLIESATNLKNKEIFETLYQRKDILEILKKNLANFIAKNLKALLSQLAGDFIKLKTLKI